MRLETINLSDIKIEDRFWTKHIHLVKDVILPYQWDIMNDKVPGAESSRCLENFKIAAGRIQGEFYGAVFQDTDIAKWMEAVGYSLSSGRNQELEALADGVVDLLAEAQQPDGYMDTYFIIREPDKKWKDLCEPYDGSCRGLLQRYRKKKIPRLCSEAGGSYLRNLWSRGGTKSRISRTPGGGNRPDKTV